MCLLSELMGAWKSLAVYRSDIRTEAWQVAVCQLDRRGGRPVLLITSGKIVEISMVERGQKMAGCFLDR